MKELIIGYITAVINNYTRTIDTFKQYNAANGSIRRFETIREEFNDLLDFVEDIPEKKEEPIIVVLLKNAAEIDSLKKRVKELEESCENFVQVEKNLNAKIKLFRAENERLNNICKLYMEGEVK